MTARFDPPPTFDRPGRRIAAELAILTGIGVMMGVLGPYGTAAAPLLLRQGYWIGCILSGGLIGLAIDRALARRSTGWRRVTVSAVGMTGPTMLLVVAANRLFFDQRTEIGDTLLLAGKVFAVSLVVMAIRALVWRRPQPIVETRTVVETKTVIEAPLPTATDAFRRRLSARRRGARLIAVEAQDHYLRVHTDAGDELVTARMADALADLSLAHGYQIHRSWWVAADAIEEVRWSRGSGEARLVNDVTAPISRQRAAVLKDAGWK